MKLTLWGTPRPEHHKGDAGGRDFEAGWQCSRPDCKNRRMLRQRYCKACHAAYERIRRQTKGAFA
jgi:hypothetical protein